MQNSSITDLLSGAANSSSGPISNGTLLRPGNFGTGPFCAGVCGVRTYPPPTPPGGCAEPGSRSPITVNVGPILGTATDVGFNAV